MLYIIFAPIFLWFSNALFIIVFRYGLNNKGDSMSPCFTPDLIGNSLEVWPSYLTTP